MKRSGASSYALPLQVWLHRRGLDQRLADGSAPERSAALGLRAAQLAGDATRESLARSLRRVVDEAGKPPTGVRSAALVCRRAVEPWREAILGLADRLERGGPVNPRGVARIAVLLADGTGPFYNATPERSIGEAIWWVADGLQPAVPADSESEQATRPSC